MIKRIKDIHRFSSCLYVQPGSDIDVSTTALPWISVQKLPAQPEGSVDCGFFACCNLAAFLATYHHIGNHLGKTLRQIKITKSCMILHQQHEAWLQAMNPVSARQDTFMLMAFHMLRILKLMVYLMTCIHKLWAVQISVHTSSLYITLMFSSWVGLRRPVNTAFEMQHKKSCFG